MTSSPQSPASELTDPMVGTRVRDYVVEARIGHGGLAVIYRVRHTVLDRLAALKVLRAQYALDPAECQRILTEARSTNSIRHPGIIDMFDVGTLDDGRPFILMEYLSGCPLGRYLRERGPVDLRLGLHGLGEVMGALHAAHGAGVTHRDLKPNNVFVVNAEGRPPYLKLLDFGLAKQAPVAYGDTPQTRVSRMVGTPEFMAPEQIRGERIGPRTDLYSAGVLAYELFTGRLPFKSETVWGHITGHLNQEPKPPSAYRPELPPELDALVLKLLQKRPEDRPTSAEEVRQALALLEARAPDHGARWDLGGLLESGPTQRLQAPTEPSEPPAECATRSPAEEEDDDEGTETDLVIAAGAPAGRSAWARVGRPAVLGCLGVATAWGLSAWFAPPPEPVSAPSPREHMRAMVPQGLPVPELAPALAPSPDPTPVAVTPEPPSELEGAARVELAPPPAGADVAPAPAPPVRAPARPVVRKAHLSRKRPQPSVAASPEPDLGARRSVVLQRVERLDRTQGLSAVGKALLQKALTDAMTAPDERALAGVSRYLDSWEQKFLATSATRVGPSR